MWTVEFQISQWSHAILFCFSWDLTALSTIFQPCRAVSRRPGVRNEKWDGRDKGPNPWCCLKCVKPFLPKASYGEANPPNVLAQWRSKHNKFEPAHDKTYNKTSATSEDSDQTAPTRSLIRVFADRMCLLPALGCSKRDELELTIRLERPAKTQIRLRIRAVWSESSLIACAFYRL